LDLIWDWKIVIMGCSEYQQMQTSTKRFDVRARCYLLFSAVIARCSSLFFRRPRGQKARLSAAQEHSSAVFFRYYSENSEKWGSRGREPVTGGTSSRCELSSILRLGRFAERLG
jgi:hypothetical protein